ncbi:MAG: DUF3465 domain-containing protein, partial [Burkholderiales bacterium]|nr:DUF3465 domain-containing protein [Burkholderiales bacterium]
GARRMKPLALLVLAVAVAAYAGFAEPRGSAVGNAPAAVCDRAASDGDAVIRQAFDSRLGNLPVTGSGTVTRLLPDDNAGSRHQRFIVTLASGQTILIAHNIDLAPRIEALQPGDPIAFAGVYEWNSKGGVVHWTHHDPAGVRTGGWLRHRNRTYR